MIAMRFWHLKPLETELRTTFELPAWPYVKGRYGPLPDELIEFFQDLSIIRLEVENRTKRFIIPTTEELAVDGETNPQEWKERYRCFTSFGQFDDKTLTITYWDPQNPSYQRYVQGPDGGIPDSAAWLEWNSRIEVIGMNDYVVRTVGTYHGQGNDLSGELGKT